jgi:hypothetical protein
MSTVTPAMGSVSMPACNAERCLTSCRYKVFRNKKPLSPTNAATAMTVAPENGALLKKRNSSSGSRLRPSNAMSATSPTPAAQNRLRMSAELQPRLGPSMIP